MAEIVKESEDPAPYGRGHNKVENPITEHQFHMIWTGAVGMTGYDKVLFRELLEKLIHEGKVIPTDHSKS